MSVQFPTRRILAPALAPPIMWPGRRRPAVLLWTPLFVVLLVVLAADSALGLDQRIADALYAWQGQRWALRHAWQTEALVHRGGRIASLLAWVTLLLAWLGSLRGTRRRHWRRPLAYLLLSTLLASALIAWLKSVSNMDCPWDLLRYGGTQPHVGLLHARPIDMARGHCFPAAHAGTGYAWVALYFLAVAVRPRWRIAGLLLGLCAGLVFGIAQQLRGAHFLSHDLCALALCWTVAAVLYHLFWGDVRGDTAWQARPWTRTR